MTEAPSLPPIAIFVGDEPLRVQEAEQALVQQALGPAGGFNLAVLLASDGDVVSRVMDLVRTVPMMSRHRVVVVRDMDKAHVELLDALMAYAEKPVPSTVLILVGPKLPEAVKGVNRGLRLQNLVKKVGRVERFKAEEQDPVAFAVDRARRLGCRLEPDAARLLVELSGRDLGLLAGEVEKASAWVGGQGQIDAAVIEQTASVVAEAEVWGLTGALVRRDVDGALAQAHRLLEDGKASHQLMAMVTWQIRNLLTLQDCMHRGIPAKDAGLRMRWSDQQEAERSLRQRPLPVAATLATLARANRAFNRARAGDRRIFERLILELVTR